MKYRSLYHRIFIRSLSVLELEFVPNSLRQIKIALFLFYIRKLGQFIALIADFSKSEETDTPLR